MKEKEIGGDGDTGRDFGDVERGKGVVEGKRWGWRFKETT